MNIEQLSNPTAKAALNAMRAGDREGWFALFTADAVLTDDGSPHDFREWSDSELFGESRGYVTSIQHEEDEGLTLYAHFHSDRWGDFLTFMKFALEDGKIIRLDVGQV